MNTPIAESSRTPRSLIVAALIITLFMSLFVLEITDPIVFHRQMARSVFFFPPAALLLWGVLMRRRWAWYAARVAMLVGIFAFGATGIAAAWFFPAIKPRDQHGIIVVSIILCTLLALAFTALGRPSTRQLFQLGGNHER
jgi:hypothetical protein